MQLPTVRTSDSMRTTLQLPSLRLPALLGALALTLGLLGPSAAHAQGSVGIVVEAFGGRPAASLLAGPTGRAISAGECMANTPIPLQLTGVPFSPTMTQYVSVWRGTQTSAACQTGTNRRSTGTTDPPCTFVGSFDVDSTMFDIPLGSMDAFDSCDTATTQEFWFLIVPAPEDNTTDVAAANYGSLLIALDPTPPSVPTGLEPAAGDTQIEISWDNPTSETLSGANIYVDPAGCDETGAVIAGGTLVAGQPPPGDPQVEVSGTAVRAATLNGEALGLEYGQYAAVAVTLVDLGTNESNLSNVVCIQRVEVRGFWDAYCADRGLDDAACTDQYGCAVSVPGGGRGWLAGLGFVLGAILLVSRRRSRR